LNVGLSLGWMKPQLLLWRMARTISARPAADRTAPTTSSVGGFSTAGLGFIRRRSTRMTRTITTSPANTSRQVHAVVTNPPMTGPTAMAAAAMPPTMP
jgi:hypothetical protein